MKTKTYYQSPRRRFGRSFIACFAAISALFASQLSAGLININFMDTMASGLSPDGPGVLGAGTWNRIIDGESGLTNSLFDNASVATVASISRTSGMLAGRNQINGNPVQNESWFDVGGFILTVTGVLPNQVYKVAVYSDRIGSGAPDTYVVNGLGQTLPSPGAAATALPGVEGVDYAIFTIASSGAGQITVAVPANGSIAGLQIQGVLNGEAGPQMDCLITKSPASTGGKSDGVYGVKNPSPKAQTLSQKVKGKKSAKFYVNVQNDGAEIDNCYLMGFWRNRHFQRVRIKDRVTGANITAAALALNHRFVLDVGETKGFFVKAKRSAKRKGNTSLQVCASPSTLVRSQQDCVMATLK